MAEQRAGEILAHVKLGRDLLAEERARRERKATEAERSVGTMVAKYLAEPEVKRRKSHDATERYLKTHWRPVHHLSAETVSRHDLVGELRKIAAERGPIAANRARSALSTLFKHAIEHGWLKREGNPCQHLPKWEERSRERVLSIEELGAIWRAAPEVDETFGRIVRLLILTGCRRSEIADLRWSEIDFDKALIGLPAVRVKSGRPVTIPLSAAALEILMDAPRINDVLVLVGFAGWSHAKKVLDAKMALPHWTIHDIRRSCRSLWIDGEHGLGLDVHLCELLLGHALPGIIGTYDRATRLAERRRALERWAELVTGEGDGAKVVRLR